MTTLGIVGSPGPEPTIGHYRRILEAWEREEPGTAPSLVIDSVDVRRALHLVARDQPALPAARARRHPPRFRFRRSS